MGAVGPPSTEFERFLPGLGQAIGAVLARCGQKPACATIICVGVCPEHDSSSATWGFREECFDPSSHGAVGALQLSRTGDGQLFGTTFDDMDPAFTVPSERVWPTGPRVAEPLGAARFAPVASLNAGCTDHALRGRLGPRMACSTITLRRADLWTDARRRAPNYSDIARTSMVRHRSPNLGMI